jgi:endogenous inhibitor of DNA gyrase (YacG/DUF329 family)
MPTFQCPTCGKTLSGLKRPEEAPYRPFCSERCQLIDLYHWFEGRYRISDPIAPDQNPAGLDAETDESP